MAMGAEVVAGGAREEVLRRIRAAIGEGSAADAAEIRGGWQALPRSYKRTASLERAAILEMLEDRLRDYDASVVRVKAGEVGAEIARVLPARQAADGGAQGAGGGDRRIAAAGFEFVVDDGLTVAELDTFEA